MNSKKVNVMFSLALILSVFLSSCAAVNYPTAPSATGELVSMPPLATLKIIEAALAGQPNTRIMIDSSYTKMMLQWDMKNGGTVFYNIDLLKLQLAPNKFEYVKQLGLSGQLGNCTDIACMQSYLQSNGWKVVSASAIEATLKSQIVGWLSTIKTTMPTFIFMFVTTPFSPDMLIEEVQS